jgi:hypothetical protein
MNLQIYNDSRQTQLDQIFAEWFTCLLGSWRDPSAATRERRKYETTLALQTSDIENQDVIITIIELKP